MSSRPIVSYDDITLPYDQPEAPVNHPSSSSNPGHAPPSKKRKKNNNNNHQKAKRREDSNASRNASNSQTAEFQKYLSNNTNSSAKTQPAQQIYEEAGVEGEEGEYEYEEEEEESRELTHQEIWDDSALVDAWDAAMEEYEAYHGPEHDWKKEPVKKSPLWYNVPFDPSKKPAATASPNTTVVPINPPSSILPTGGAENDSKPLDFDTFVPTHDPTLDSSSSPAGALPSMQSEASYIPDTPAGSMVSQDEAFQRALTAMYWGGYWTAMYHSRRHLSQTQQASATTTQNPPIPVAEDNEDDEELEEGDEIEVDEQTDEFISTQR